jgi:hypothetical protein
MKIMKEDLLALFGDAKPSVTKYHAFVNGMPPEKRGIFCKQTYATAFSEWAVLTPPYRLFLIRLIKSERQQFIEYVRNETILGEFLYEPEELNLFLKVVNILEQPCINHKTSYTDLAFSLSFFLKTDLSVKYLSDKIRYAKMDSLDFVEILEKSREIACHF